MENAPPIERRRVGDTILAVRVLAMPKDTNAAGDIFGGWLMSQVDIAGSIAAWQAAGGRVVTVAVNSFRFIKPVLVGDLVSCYSQVTRIGNTSVTVDVEVYAEPERDPDAVHKVAEATLAYVAIDEDRNPRPISGI